MRQWYISVLEGTQAVFCNNKMGKIDFSITEASHSWRQITGEILRCDGAAIAGSGMPHSCSLQCRVVWLIVIFLLPFVYKNDKI